MMNDNGKIRECAKNIVEIGGMCLAFLSISFLLFVVKAQLDRHEETAVRAAIQRGEARSVTIVDKTEDTYYLIHGSITDYLLHVRFADGTEKTVKCMYDDYKQFDVGDTVFLLEGATPMPKIWDELPT